MAGRELADSGLSSAGAGQLRTKELLEELALEGQACLDARTACVLRALALFISDSEGLSPAAELTQDTSVEILHERGLLTVDDARRWLAENDLQSEDFLRIVKDEARMRWVSKAARQEVNALLLDHLKLQGEYSRLLERAGAKRRLLKTSGLEDPDLADTGLDEEKLLRWHFESKLNQSIPTILTTTQRQLVSKRTPSSYEA